MFKKIYPSFSLDMGLKYTGSFRIIEPGTLIFGTKQMNDYQGGLLLKSAIIR